MKSCQENKCQDPHYSTRDGLLYWKGRLLLPSQSPLIHKVLLEYHSSPIGGHSGITRTLARTSAQFYWHNMRTDIRQFIHQCAVCQQAKTPNQLSAGLLQPLPIPQQVWEDVAVDFITGLPLSFGCSVIIVVVDRLTKYGHFFALKSDYDSKKVAEVFLKNVVKLHGMPKSIVSDRDKVFTSKFWQHLFHLSGTTLAMSTAYHPQSDGQSEALNKCLEMYLRCLTFQRPKQWYKALPWAEFWYNTSYHMSAGMTPFKALYGKDPPTLTRYQPSPDDPIDVQTQLTSRDEILQLLKQNQFRAQQTMKAQADKKRQHIDFAVGDNVLVKLQPYRQASVALRKHQKLGMRYFGPFSIVAKVGAVAYKLQLPSAAKIHPIFHVLQLKLFRGSVDAPYLPLPFTTSEEGPILQPAAVLQRRTVLQGSVTVPQVLIQWTGLDEASATWEDQADVQLSYPNFNLVERLILKGRVMQGCHSTKGSHTMMSQ